jgi:hypothetical protein
MANDVLVSSKYKDGVPGIQVVDCDTRSKYAGLKWYNLAPYMRNDPSNYIASTGTLELQVDFVMPKLTYIKDLQHAREGFFIGFGYEFLNNNMFFVGVRGIYDATKQYNMELRLWFMMYCGKTEPIDGMVDLYDAGTNLFNDKTDEWYWGSSSSFSFQHYERISRGQLHVLRAKVRTDKKFDIAHKFDVPAIDHDIDFADSGTYDYKLSALNLGASSSYNKLDTSSMTGRVAVLTYKLLTNASGVIQTSGSQNLVNVMFGPRFKFRQN